MPSSIVIGAGWAGLNCAYELTKAGHEVTVLEAAPQVGGRARSVDFANYAVDNGQHIALGAYHTLRQILRELSIEEEQCFKILPLELSILGQPCTLLRLQEVSTPWNLLRGIVTTLGFNYKEKLQILWFAIQMHMRKYQLAQDCTIEALLLNYNQSSKVIEQLWAPLALAAMSTDIKRASAQIFLNVLKKTFTADFTNSHWYLPTVDLSTLLPEKLVDFLTQQQQHVICTQTIKQISKSKQQGWQVASTAHSWSADNVVIATAPWQALRLLEAHPELQELCACLRQFQYETITTVYLQFPQPVQLAYPILGILRTTSQWIFDRAFASQPDILSVVITGAVDVQLQNNTELYRQILSELRQQLPTLPEPIAHKIVREKRAAFTCDVAIQKARPTAGTALKNLWLCGDYLQTGLPATLEGALLSGKKTSAEILLTC